MFRSLMTQLTLPCLVSFCFHGVAAAQRTPSDMEIIMERMDDAFKLISNGIRIGTLGAKHVDAIEAFQGDATEAALLPLPTQALCVQLAYQTSMLELIGEALEMENQIEIAIGNGSPQNLDAVTLVWKKMAKLRKQGHKDCQEPEEDTN